MNGDRIILPEALRDSKPLGVLHTEEEVRQASEELREATEADFKKFQASRQAALEEATRRFLD